MVLTIQLVEEILDCYTSLKSELKLNGILFFDCKSTINLSGIPFLTCR